MQEITVVEISAGTTLPSGVLNCVLTYNVPVPVHVPVPVPVSVPVPPNNGLTDVGSFVTLYVYGVSLKFSKNLRTTSGHQKGDTKKITHCGSTILE
jgi:hypothetical protein